MPSRGLLTVAALVGIALMCLASLRKLERERRLLGRLRSLDPGRALLLNRLSAEERDTARSLAAAGVVVIQGDRLYLKGPAVSAFRRKRIRLALSGVFAALVLVFLVAVLLLHR